MLFKQTKKFTAAKQFCSAKTDAAETKNFKIYFREKQKTKSIVNKTDKNKPMRLIKEHKEIVEMSVLNKSKISKDTF